MLNTFSDTFDHFSNEGPRFPSSPGLNDAALNLAAAKEGGGPATGGAPRLDLDRSNQWANSR